MAAPEVETALGTRLRVAAAAVQALLPTSTGDGEPSLAVLRSLVGPAEELAGAMVEAGIGPDSRDGSRVGSGGRRGQWVKLVRCPVTPGLAHPYAA